MEPYFNAVFPNIRPFWVHERQIGAPRDRFVSDMTAVAAVVFFHSFAFFSSSVRACNCFADKLRSLRYFTTWACLRSLSTAELSMVPMSTMSLYVCLETPFVSSCKFTISMAPEKTDGYSLVLKIFHACKGKGGRLAEKSR